MLGFRPDRIDALLAGLAETVGGLLLACGFMTPPGAAAVIGVMLAAVLTLDAFLHYNHSGTVW